MWRYNHAMFKVCKIAQLKMDMEYLREIHHSSQFHGQMCIVQFANHDK